MRHGSLFSGIGGFDLASELMGWENVFHCEWNPFGQKVLKYYWPNAISYDDITKTDFTIHRRHIDILTGGFPCQPYSTAGKRKAKEDERHLWPSMLRAIREVRPRWVVGENVRGLVSWDGGLVFEEVQAELEAEGYEVQPFLLPAASVNAPHRRDRIWFVAYCDFDQSFINGNFTDTKSPGQQTCSVGQREEQFGGRNISMGPGQWDRFPTVSPICTRDDGISDRLDSITFSKWRNESIKAGGNAIVPQVVFQIFKAIDKYNQLNKQLTF